MQRVIITGGNGCLARHLADTFRTRGDEVIAPGRDELDVTDPDRVAAWFAATEAPDLLVLNAGTAENALLARTDEAGWDRQMDVNLNGAFRCAKAALRGMIRQRSGHLVFISSHAAGHPAPGQSAYGASKAALIGFARSLARETGPANLRVNVILPGFLETPMTDDISGPRLDGIVASHALGRLNTPAAAAAFIAFLHHELPHTSGQVFQLDSRVG